MRLFFAIAMMASFDQANQPPNTPTLDKLGLEASRLMAEAPDGWAAFRAQVDRADEVHAKLIAGWRNRSSPPPLDLKPLKLPLAFLVAEARRLGEAPGAIDHQPPGGMMGMGSPPLVRFEGGRTWPHAAYLDAIAGHPDARRIEALLEYRDALERRWPGIGRSIPWSRLHAQAANRDWAIGRIRDLTREAPAFNPRLPIEVLPFLLIDRFAGDLPPDAMTIAYDYLRAQDPLGPRNGERIWDVLLRLDPPRARREILPYFHQFRGKAYDFNIYVVMLLSKHAGPSLELAKEARTWLAKDNLDPDFRRDIRVILLRADPDHEIKATTEYVDRLLAERAKTGEPLPIRGDVNWLLPALGQVNTKEADDALARYVFERTISDFIREQFLEYLAKHDYPGMPALLARWLAEEAPHMRSYVRKKAAEKWGESGRRLLEQVDRGK